LSLELFQVVQELRFAGQPQEVKANHLLHSFCHSAQADRVEQAARLLNWASGRRDQNSPSTAQADRVEQAARLLNWASGRRHQNSPSTAPRQTA
jgi:hypothetical protein